MIQQARAALADGNGKADRGGRKQHAQHDRVEGDEKRDCWSSGSTFDSRRTRRGIAISDSAIAENTARNSPQPHGRLVAQQKRFY